VGSIAVRASRLCVLVLTTIAENRPPVWAVTGSAGDVMTIATRAFPAFRVCRSDGDAIVIVKNQLRLCARSDFSVPVADRPAVTDRRAVRNESGERSGVSPPVPRFCTGKLTHAARQVPQS
jgi:hypothetical protein